MKKLLLILITIFITTNVYADHYKKKIDIKNLVPSNTALQKNHF